jgi:hypothetical protein
LHRFQLHDLERLVGLALVFVFVLTEGVLSSEWCVEGFPSTG